MANTPTISPLPEAPNRNTDSPSSFSNKTDSFLTAIRTFQGEANTVAEFAGNATKSVSGIGLAFYQDVELADTNNSDPGDGKLKFNNATQTSATELYLDDIDTNSTNVRNLITFLDNVNPDQTIQGHISLRDRQEPAKWLVYEVTGITQNSGYTAVTVQNGEGASDNPFADADTATVGFTRAGFDGTTFNVIGTWGSNTAYDKNDIVSHNGTAYVALQDTDAGDEPGVSSKWTTFATAGDVTSVNGKTGDVNLAIDFQEFSADGTWTKPSGAVQVIAEIVGSGGGGANVPDASDAGGGGGGGFVRIVKSASDFDSSEAVGVGAGGSGGADGGNNLGAMGERSFLDSLSGQLAAGVGTLGTEGAGGSGDLANPLQSQASHNIVGGLGGERSTNVSLSGQASQTGSGGGFGNGIGAFSVYGGAGGGGASNSGSSPGGSTEFGGPGGAGEDNNNTPGENGSVPGGGGGASSNDGGGGDGGAGRVRIWTIIVEQQ